MTIAPRLTIGVIAAFALAGAAPAQDAPVRGLDNFAAPAAQPTAVPTPPVPTPVAPVIVLPTVTPTPAETPPPPVRTSAPRPTATQPVARAAPRAVPPSQAVETPAPTPVATPTPAAPPAPAPATPTPTASATPVPQTAASADRPLWPWLLGAAVLAVAGIAFARRRRDRAESEAHAVAEPEAIVAPAPPAAPVAPVQSAGITLALRPLRAGLNLLSATVECEVTIANPGDLPAEAIRLDIRLTSAHAGLDADLAAHAAQPVQRPATPPFALAPGETRTVRKVVALPRDAIHVITAADRPMFVPIVAATAHFRAADADLSAAQAFAVGVERVDSPKLSPLWLDGPPRMFDNVAARVHVARR